MTVLSVDGSELIHSTYLGGEDDEVATGIAIGAHGVVLVTGETRSADFPLHIPLQDGFGGGVADVFVAGWDPHESLLVFSTYIGGSGDDIGADITVDSAGHIYLTGQTTSLDFDTVHPWQGGMVGRGTDAFVAKLRQDGLAFVYSTYLGGEGFDSGLGIAADVSGHAYVTGMTDSTDFPTTDGVVQSVAMGAGDAFVTKINPDGSELIYSTYLGGTELDEGRGIAIDSQRHVYVIGRTASPDFFEVVPVQDEFGGTEDMFLTKLGSSGSMLEYSTYLGGTRSDSGNGVAIDGLGNAYITGTTHSIEFPTVATFRNLLGQASSGAAFIGTIDRDDILQPDLPDLAVTLDRVKIKMRSAGARIVVECTVKNVGTVDARDPFLIVLLLSENTRRDNADLVIQSVEIDGLQSGLEMKHKFKASNLDLDSRFLIARSLIVQVDNQDTVIESNEVNNTAVRSIVDSVVDGE